jgi:hypothetical protein
MTPRLKKLIILFGASVLILIVDKISTPSASKSVSKKTQVQKITTKENLDNSQNKEVVINHHFTKVSEEILSLKGWNRNPFVKVYTASPSQSRGYNNRNEKAPVKLAELDNIKVSSVVKIGNDSAVIIDGKSYRKGDSINNMIIDKIDHTQLTLKLNGKKYVIKIGS